MNFPFPSFFLYSLKVSPVRYLDDEVLLVAGDDHVYGGQFAAPNVAVVLYGSPHRVLEQLGQDVIQRHLNVGEVGSDVA